MQTKWSLTFTPQNDITPTSKTRTETHSGRKHKQYSLLLYDLKISVCVWKYFCFLLYVFKAETALSNFHHKVPAASPTEILQCNSRLHNLIANQPAITPITLSKIVRYYLWTKINITTLQSITQTRVKLSQAVCDVEEIK